MSTPYIPITRAFSIATVRKDKDIFLIFPYKIRFKDRNGKVKITNRISLKFLMNAIQLTNLQHPVTEDIPKPVDITSIISCYIFGSSVHPRYEKVTKKYLYGLYIKEKEERVISNDIDIICFTNGTHGKKHIKSMSSWETEINSSYRYHNEKNYCNFDISFIPAHSIERSHNIDFINHIKDHGVCMMGNNIVESKRYALWSHDTIKDEITCLIPIHSNVSEEEIKRKESEEELNNRFEIMDL